jgi:hypothetical protein
MYRACILAILSLLGFVSCVSTRVDKVDAAAGFNWDTLKRDLIVMTSLIDLRDEVERPPGFDAFIQPFSEKEAMTYAETFKEVFFKYRKDIRVFGAGGAFEGISKIKNLKDLSRKVLAKQELTKDEQDLFDRERQDKRFIFFFYFDSEKLHFDYSVSTPADAKGLYVEKNYFAKRTMVVKLALYDTKVGKTVFITQKTLVPEHRNQVLVRTGLSPKAVKGSKGRYASARDPDIYDQMGRGSLDHELRYHRSRFPVGFPAREPSFTGSFDDLALSLPIKKSEQNLIEYEYFTFHRPELTVKNAEIGPTSMTSLFIGSSSIIYNRFRWGLGVEFGGAGESFKFEGKDYDIGHYCFCMTTDLEWELSDSVRLLTGSVLGAGSFNITLKEEELPGAEVEEKKKPKGDGYWYAAPRIKFIFGGKEGLQFGIGAYKQFYSGLIEPQLIQNKPGQWGGEISILATFRGF